MTRVALYDWGGRNEVLWHLNEQNLLTFRQISTRLVPRLREVYLWGKIGVGNTIA